MEGRNINNGDDIRPLLEKGIPIPLGFSGENGVRWYRFGYGDFVNEYGDGAINFNHQRPGDSAPTPCAIECEDNVAVWTISNTDTQFSGQGRIQIVFTVDGIVKKTVVGLTQIEASLGEAIPADEPMQSYIDQIIELKGEIHEDAVTAEDSATSASESAQSAQEALQSLEDMTATASVDANVGVPSVQVTKTEDEETGVTNLDFAFHNLKGEKGDTGDVNLITFDLDPETGHLYANYTYDNSEIQFYLNNNGHIEVGIA